MPVTGAMSGHHTLSPLLRIHPTYKANVGAAHAAQWQNPGAPQAWSAPGSNIAIQGYAAAPSSSQHQYLSASRNQFVPGGAVPAQPYGGQSGFYHPSGMGLPRDQVVGYNPNAESPMHDDERARRHAHNVARQGAVPPHLFAAQQQSWGQLVPPTQVPTGGGFHPNMPVTSSSMMGARTPTIVNPGGGIPSASMTQTSWNVPNMPSGSESHHAQSERRLYNMQGRDTSRAGQANRSQMTADTGDDSRFVQRRPRWISDMRQPLPECPRPDIGWTASYRLGEVYYTNITAPHLVPASRTPSNSNPIIRPKFRPSLITWFEDVGDGLWVAPLITSLHDERKRSMHDERKRSMHDASVSVRKSGDLRTVSRGPRDPMFDARTNSECNASAG
ncbi:hypothetical protein OH77DRAFT_270758 [Trametes cingulata]|nr:hypothetical protein OH77DRAFT_270758 [Trametes cingulata]